MNLDLNPEQAILKEAAARYAAERYDDSARRAHATATHGFDRAVWREMAELGWIGAGLPEQRGGFGGGPVETMVIMEQAGAALMQEPLLPAMVMAGQAMVAAGVDAAAFEPIIAGEEIVVAAFCGPDDREALAMRRNGAGGTLFGTVAFALNADAADTLLFAAKADEGSRLLVRLPRRTRGLELTPFRTMDDRRAARITLDGAPVAEDQVLARGDAAESAVRAATDHASAAIAAEATGVAQALFDRTLAYVKERQQFGQPIARFQALQHRLADMHVALEEARSLAVMATVTMAGGTDAGRARALGGALAGVLPRTLHVARESIQLHGGVGMTDDLPVGAGFRRLKTIELMMGGANRHLDRVLDG